jgi:Uma2 family endonuclease
VLAPTLAQERARFPKDRVKRLSTSGAIKPVGWVLAPIFTRSIAARHLTRARNPEFSQSARRAILNADAPFCLSSAKRNMSTLPDHFSTTSAEPAWDIATVFPAQGAWTVEEYLDFTDATNHLIEFTDGKIEVLEMPTNEHQDILICLFLMLHQFVTERDLGKVSLAALRIQISKSKFREPDILFVRKDHLHYVQNRYWTGADLVMEIVSADANSRQRDLVTKPADYAAAGISEYWIVDPKEKTITVLALENGEYKPFGAYRPGEQAKSRLLEGFSANVAAVFEALNR